MTQSKKRLGLAIPMELYQKIADRAKYHGKTINSTCLDVFWDYFEASGNGKTRENKPDEPNELFRSNAEEKKVG